MGNIDTPSDRARVVLVTGAPGSGKTTLGAALASTLRVPFLARDEVRGGLFFSAGAWSTRPRRVPPAHESVEAFLRILETAAGLGVSCVAEYVVRRSRPGDLRRVSAAADCVVVRTECRDPMARVARRIEQDQLLSRAAVIGALGHETAAQHRRHALARMHSVADEMRTDFDLPTLVVRTDHGWEPGLDTVVDFVVAGAPAPS